MTTKKTTAKKTSAKKTEVFKPISEEIMPYGGKRFRTPIRKDEFFGTQGSPIPAYIFDIDGTLQGWGRARSRRCWIGPRNTMQPTRTRCSS